MSQRSRPSRRQFLRAAGALGLALPLLDSLSARAEATPRPKRLLLFYNPNGTVQDAWWPKPGSSETDFELNTIHAELERHKERLLIFKGVDLKVAISGRGGPHQRGIGGLFTGQQLQEGIFVDGCGSQAGWANGPSVDQVVAKAIGADTPLRSLELAIRAPEADVQSRISYAAAGQPLPPLNDPLSTYLRLFSQSDVPPEEIDAITQRRRSVLDAVRDQFAALDQRVSPEDRHKLQAHLESVRNVERRLGGLHNGSASCSGPLQPPELDPNGEDAMPEIMQLQLELLAMAFACDITRVASLQVSTAQNRIRFPWLNSLGSGHALSHEGPSNLAAREELVKRAAWHAERLAFFLDLLAQIPEGDGSVLDNTLVLWGNELSRGNEHTHRDMPFLIAGNAGGAIRTGRYLTFDGASHNDLLVSVMNAMGVEGTTFGHPEFCNGPLPGLT